MSREAFEKKLPKFEDHDGGSVVYFTDEEYEAAFTGWQSATEQSAKELDQLKSDCNFLHDKNQRLDNLLHTLDKELQELRALVAMKDAALSYAQWQHSDLAFDTSPVQKAKAASTSTVASWEKENLEPLRQQVAMLSAKWRNCAYYFNEEGYPEFLIECDEVLSNTQSASEAFMNEERVKVLEEVKSELYPTTSIYLGAINIIENKISKLSAANKEVK